MNTVGGPTKPRKPEPDIGFALLKIQRGNQQYNTLETEIKAFMERKPYEIISAVDADPETGKDRTPERWLGVVRVKDHPPDLWPVVIGEMLHNFRSAMDQIVWQLVFKNTRTYAPIQGTGSRTQFPIFTDKAGFQRTGIPHHLAGVSKKAQAFIESLQPFATGEGTDSPLWHLALLSNWDKHNAISLIGAHAIDPSVQATGAPRTEDGIFGVGMTKPGPFEDGAVLLWAYVPPGDAPIEQRIDKMNVKGKVGFSLVFEYPSCLRGKKVVQTLHAAALRINEIAMQIRGRFFS